MKIAHISSEVAPWCKSGGLGDVLGALPAAQARAGAQVAVFLPLHRSARESADKRGIALQPTGVTVTAQISGHQVSGHFLAHQDASGVTTFLLDCQRFFDRDGLYADADGRSYGDNGVRYSFFCQGVLQAASRLMGGTPDVLHAHDWQAALIPIYLRHAPIPTVLTIHNLAYQGAFHKDLISAIGLDWDVFSPSCAEFYDHLGLLKGGIACANAVTTVSPSYAREITTPQFGHGLHEFIRHHARRLTGIINGIDEQEWSPEHDPHITQNFSATDLSGKWACRQALQAEFGLQLAPGEPLLAVVSRFASQKGLDLIADIAPELESMRAGLVVLGTGDPALEKRFAWLSRRFRRVSARIDFDVPLAHRITAGADMFLMPSRFEPCGLNQLYAMAAGTVPVVHAVGGLADTVDHQVGFRFGHPTADGLRWALHQAIGCYRHDSPAWHRKMVSGMRRDFSWQGPAQQYLRLYRSLQ
jgi:starch synthase